ncbi:MAG: RagB/SusD family nutrient uptake outer membrane protein [Firmicutes bacterium]|jgi:hypothetical protein|nr:RagB/SusD family nutrient uptake outer membrane protein [Bacteroidales bacterium]NMB01224.1 RagB/SusD family nutrient uptake outer membrane protein [Bacillota bacterium]
MKKNILYTIIFLTSVALGVSCTDFLDKDLRTDTNLTYEQIFQDPHLAPGFLNNAYTLLPDGFNRLGSAMMASACDEAEHSDAGSPIRLFNSNSISASYNPDDVWSNMYTGIRKCNIFLKELDGLIVEYNSIPEAERPNYKGQALFLRAFYHFELLKRYQKIIYVDKVIDPFDEDEIYALKQIDFHAAVELIAADCDSAANLLPNRITDDAQKGRPGKAAPMALKARLYLYAASPLNNPDNDLELWSKAESAAKELYDNRSQLGIGLESSFSGIFTTPYNNEIIFASRATNRNDIESANFPISYQGSGYTNPSQNLVDAFVMSGTSYKNEMNGYDANDPYTKRENRFYATILHNNANFKDVPVETFVGGKDGLFATSTATKTGYYMRKFVTPAINLEKNETARRPWIFFRYAEVLLNYAEARNEILDAPDKTVHDLINLIRSRAGLRPFRNTSEYIQTKEEMRDYIKRERQVELAFEEHRFWDLRRWKDAEVVLNQDIQGMQIEKADDTFTYTRFTAAKRSFDPKFYWYPIPRTEILKYKSKGVTLEQNPGWE